MTVIATLILTVVILTILFLLFIKLKTPYYRVDKSKIIHLLEMVLSGQALENDWYIVMGMTIRHSAELETIRQRCAEIEEQWYIGEQKPPYLFTAEGLAALEDILNELKSSHTN